MHFKTGSAAVGIRLLAITLAGALSLTALNSTAQEIANINGAIIDNSVLEIYAESRIQRPLNSLSAEERSGLIDELRDLYILSSQPGTDELKKDRRVAAQIELQVRAIVAQAFATKFLTENEITDEEIITEYNIQSGMAPPLQFKARHILVPTQAEAIELIGKLDTGSDFATLAIESSTGPSSKDGGALPWFSPNQMVKPFSDAVAALEDGKYTTDPVQTEFGWHVILREESRVNEPPPLESIREDIKQNIAQKKFQVHLEKLRADASSAD
jgi:peptidyl-prolyl cis-trans isomerase C